MKHTGRFSKASWPTWCFWFFFFFLNIYICNYFFWDCVWITKWVHLVNRHVWFQMHLISGFIVYILKWAYRKLILNYSYNDNYDFQTLYYTMRVNFSQCLGQDFYFVVLTIIVQHFQSWELNTFTIAGFTEPTTTTMAEVREILQIAANNALVRST